MNRGAWGIALALALAAPRASAQDSTAKTAEERGLHLAAHATVHDLRERGFEPHVGGALEVGYRLDRRNVLGLYGGGSTGPVAFDASHELCTAMRQACSVGSTMVYGGLFAVHRFLPDSLFDPWLFGALGASRHALTVEGVSGANVMVAKTGADLRMGGGVDLHVSRTFAVGPFAELSFVTSGSTSTLGGGLRVVVTP